MPGAVVLKTGPNPLHSGAIGIARSLGRLGEPVYVAGETSADPAARSRYVRDVWPIPAQVTTAAQTVEWLLRMAPGTGSLLIPVDDLGADLTARYGTELAVRYRFPQLGAGVIEALGDKHQLASSAAAAGVPAPRHCSPTTEAELDAVAGELGWPVVVKARDTALLATTPGAKSVAIARDLAMLRTQWRTHLLAGGPNCIVQEYIPGGPETVWMVNAYYDASSTPRFAAAGRKIRQHPAYTGATSLGRTERNEEVLALTERLVRHVGYRGILDIGWRFDARDGAYKVLDANPRIGATFRLFAADDGTDVVRAMRADLTGGVMPTGTVRDGRTWLNEPADLRTVRHYFADGALTLPAYLRSLTRVDECAWYSADDRAPITPVLRDLARDVAGRVRIPRAQRAQHRGTIPSVGR